MSNSQIYLFKNKKLEAILNLHSFYVDSGISQKKAELLMSNLLDFNHEKNPGEQPKFFFRLN